MKIMITILIGFILLSSCNDNSTNNTQPQPFTINDFPMKIGYWWSYQFEGGTNIDTLTLKYGYELNFAGVREITCYWEKHKIVFDSSTIVISNSLISWNGWNGYLIGPFFSSLPFTQNDSSGGNFFVNNYFESYNVLGNYFNVYSLIKTENCMPGIVRDTILISKNIGIVYESANGTGAECRGNEYLKLIDYHLSY